MMSTIDLYTFCLFLSVYKHWWPCSYHSALDKHSIRAFNSSIHWVSIHRPSNYRGFLKLLCGHELKAVSTHLLSGINQPTSFASSSGTSDRSD